MVVKTDRSEIAVVFMGVLGQERLDESLGGMCHARPIHEPSPSQSAGDVHG